MSEADSVITSLDQLEKMFTTNQSEVANALGLLFLGKRFERPKKEEEFRDPTSMILESPSLPVPEL